MFYLLKCFKDIAKLLKDLYICILYNENCNEYDKKHMIIMRSNINKSNSKSLLEKVKEFNKENES